MKNFIADEDVKYRHDPEHRNKPKDGNWVETKSGWTTRQPKKEQEQSKPQKTLVPKAPQTEAPAQKNPSFLRDFVKKAQEIKDSGLIKYDGAEKPILEEKDIERINAIIYKSNYVNSIAEKYVKNMANAITDASKAARRGVAILSEYTKDGERKAGRRLADIFFSKALELKNKKTVTPVTPTPPKIQSMHDSISDIGAKGLLKKGVGGKYQIEQKDKERMISILNKAGGDASRAGMFVRNMANAITDPAKAARRGVSAFDVFKGHFGADLAQEFAEVFLNKAKELAGITKNEIQEPPPPYAPKPSVDAMPEKPFSPVKAPAKAPAFKKVTPRLTGSMHYLIKDYKLKKDEVEELAGFKETIKNHPRMTDPEYKKRVLNGIKLPRNQQQLKNAFVSHMDASNYTSPEAFNAAKQRILKMSVNDFGKLLAAINSDEEVIV